MSEEWVQPGSDVTDNGSNWPRVRARVVASGALSEAEIAAADAQYDHWVKWHQSYQVGTGKQACPESHDSAL